MDKMEEVNNFFEWMWRIIISIILCVILAKI